MFLSHLSCYYNMTMHLKICNVENTFCSVASLSGTALAANIRKDFSLMTPSAVTLDLCIFVFCVYLKPTDRFDSQFVFKAPLLSLTEMEVHGILKTFPKVKRPRSNEQKDAPPLKKTPSEPITGSSFSKTHLSKTTRAVSKNKAPYFTACNIFN